MCHTYVILRLSQTSWDEIADKLCAAGYGHAFHAERDGVVIDMHGIAVQAEAVLPTAVTYRDSPEDGEKD